MNSDWNTNEQALDITEAMITCARAAGSDLVRRTPTLTSRGLSQHVGGAVVLKAENLQRTGSFKLRGVLAKLADLPEGSRGVVTGSAGNHAQSLAYAAKARGLKCNVFMPETASLSKLAATEDAGATIVLGGSSVDECVESARTEATAADLSFVHPFDDPWVIAGQATVGIELLEQVEDLTRVLVPVGGGGLAAGIATALKTARPEVEVVGVQAQACAAFHHALDPKHEAFNPQPTVADGIAIKRPGALTLPLLERHLDDLVVTSEDEIAEAMMLVLERTKLLLEGAGAVGVAALISGRVRTAPQGSTVVVLSGGNIDTGLLGAICHWWETEAGRRLRLFTRLPDRPGALAALLVAVGNTGANVVDVDHVRDGVHRHVRETGVELVVETRGGAHARQIRSALQRAGFRSAAVEPEKTAAHH